MKRKVLVCLLSLVMMSAFSKENKAKASPTASRFEKLELFNRVLHLIENQYYREVDTEKLIQGAIKGMMGTLDPHSAYLDKKVFSKMQEDTKGEFGGLGIEVSQKDGMIVIITPIIDTPAYKAGIKPGDKIVEINHESILGYNLEDVIDRMKGKTGTKIVLGVARDGADGIVRFTIKRTLIKVSSVKSELVNDRFGYVRLIQFQKGSGKGISKAIKRLKRQAKKKTKKDLEGIVLDLRNNPGGLLDEAVNVSSIFLKGGVVVSTEARDPKQKEIRYVKKTGHKELKVPLVVLINGSSASASEIVAGALQDSKRALIVGEQSFGKGSVQSVAPLGKEQGVKLTIAQYMTPSNKKIQAIGIVPDIKIENLSNEWIEENKKQGSFIRERDLKNHLTATIESKEEKASRLKQEKIERKERIAALKKKNKKGKKGPVEYVAAEDYQVIQAIKILRSYKISRGMN
jgi:carboxyl-terminal processing protease